MGSLSRREKERKMHEEDILKATEQIFSIKGFDGTSIDEIAQAAQFTRRTIYQYFSSKEDIFLAIAINGYERLFSYFTEVLDKGNTGFEKLRLCCLAYYQFYKDFPDTFRLMNYIGHIRKKTKGSSRERNFLALNDSLFKTMTDIIEKGKGDGSIKQGFDAKQGAFSAAFLVTGFLHELAFTGKSFTDHYAFDQDDFVSFTLDMIMQSFHTS